MVQHHKTASLIGRGIYRTGLMTPVINHTVVTLGACIEEGELSLSDQIFVILVISYYVEIKVELHKV